MALRSDPVIPSAVSPSSEAAIDSPGSAPAERVPCTRTVVEQARATCRETFGVRDRIRASYDKTQAALFEARASRRLALTSCYEALELLASLQGKRSGRKGSEST